MGACLKAKEDLLENILIAGVSPALPVWKRFMDLFLIILALPVILPVSALIAVAIKLTSGSPVFFRQQRIGYLGKPFICLKFRTMNVGADSGIHENHLKGLIAAKAPLTKMDEIGDSRLAPFGGILRVTGLDELPQLLNVVKREMSLVGPRPCLRYEWDKLTAYQKRRLTALPGITGLWQTNGKNKTTFDEMIHWDITYAYEKSVWVDLRILFRTFPVVLAQAREAIRRVQARRRKSNTV